MRRDASGCDVAAADEAHRRAECVGGGQAGEIEAGPGRLEVPRQFRCASHQLQLRAQLRGEEREALEVDPVARARDRVIDLELAGLSAVREEDWRAHALVGEGSPRRFDFPSRPARPASAGRGATRRPPGRASSRATRTRRSSGRKRNDGVSLEYTQSFHPIPSGASGSRRRAKRGRGSSAGLGFQRKPGARTTSCGKAPRSRSRTAVSSADCPPPTTATRRPRSCSNDACSEACVTKFVRKPAQLRRHVRERHDAGRDHDAARGDELAVRELEHETERIVLDAHDVALVDLSNRALAEPVAVRDERVERHRTGDVAVVAPRLGAKVAERVPPAWVAEVGREALGLEEHSFWHVQAPRAHRPTEDAYWAGRRFQMRRDRKPVGSGATTATSQELFMVIISLQGVACGRPGRWRAARSFLRSRAGPAAGRKG